MDYAGTALAPGASLQIDPDNAIGVHYGDWRSWNAANDWSWRPGFGFQENPRLVLLNSAGTVLQGELPSDSLYAGRTRIQSVVPHVREEQSVGANWSAPRFQLENVGDSVANPLVFYYFHEQGELSLPVAWQCTHCTVRLDSLGGGDWRLVLDYAGYTLPANNSLWEAEAYVGLRHTDWSPWNHADDVPRTEVRNAQGELLGSLGGTP